MQAGQILQNKGHEVITIPPASTVAEAVALLHRYNVGAVVVSSDGVAVEGILSERDVVRRMSTDGAAALDRPVSDLMAREVATCSPDTNTDDLMSMMTEGRFRHLPVVDDGRLVGIVSIGDAVKVRMDQLKLEREQLEEYIRAGG